MVQCKLNNLTKLKMLQYIENGLANRKEYTVDNE